MAWRWLTWLLLLSHSLLQQHQTQWQSSNRSSYSLPDTAITPPPKNMLDRLMGVSNPEETYRAVMKLTRGDAMAVTQILSGRYFPNHPSLQLNPQPKTNINIAIWTLASKPELFPYHVSPPFFLYFFFISVLVSKWVCFCTNNLTPGQTSTRKRKFWEGKKAEYFLSKTQ